MSTRYLLSAVLAFLGGPAVCLEPKPAVGFDDRGIDVPAAVREIRTNAAATATRGSLVSPHRSKETAASM